MPREATNEMLKAMDECSTEGYDERLYSGHAASVYMAAWDASDTAYRPGGLAQPAPVQEPVAWINAEKRTFEWNGPVLWSTPTVAVLDKIPLYTTPPQRTWVGLTDEEIMEALGLDGYDSMAIENARAIEAKLKEKNT
jgi:hypothetical protein